jgi:hypothetical protein
VLGILGKQEASSAPLDEIVHLYRELLNGCIRERDPFYWATTKTNLGLALKRSVIRRKTQHGSRRQLRPIATP